MGFIIPTRRDNLSRSSFSVALTCLGALMLTACDSGSGGVSDDASDFEVDTAGRLAFYNAEGSSVSVMDLDSGVMEASFPVSGESPRVYASASKRYAVLVQRDEGRVSFLDSGLYVEDHGDHLHEYKVDPSMQDSVLTGSRPTHITEHDDTSAVFYDGEEGVVSSVQLFNDADISAGLPGLSFDLENNMHGVARQVEHTIFVTYRDPSITETTLPAAVERYSINADSVAWEHRYTESCPVLHGSAQNEDYLLFGCSDGVLAIALEQEGFPAAKLANPVDLEEGKRIGAVYAQHEVETFVGVAGDQLFVIDPTGVDLPVALSIPEGESRLDQGFTNNGEWFYVLTGSGVLHLFDVAQDFAAVQLEPFDSAYPETVSGRLVTQSASGEALYLLDPTGTKIFEVAADDQTIVNRFDLGFVASYPTWLGFAEGEEHDHDHDHDD